MRNELWVIWKNPKSRRRYLIGELVQEDNGYTFKYSKDEIEGFDYFPGFANKNETYYSQELFSNILNRLPNPNRPDYEDILSSYELNKDSSKMEMLQKTKGRLLTDTFEFVEPFNENNIVFEVAGIRHCSDFRKCKDKLKIEDEVILKLEKDNKYDDNAIMIVYMGKYEIGDVPRYYSKPLADLLKKEIKYNAVIMKLNIDSKFDDENVTVKVIIEK